MKKQNTLRLRVNREFIFFVSIGLDWKCNGGSSFFFTVVSTLCMAEEPLIVERYRVIGILHEDMCRK